MCCKSPNEATKGKQNDINLEIENHQRGIFIERKLSRKLKKKEKEKKGKQASFDCWSSCWDQVGGTGPGGQRWGHRLKIRMLILIKC